jgi:hypothetical protein
MVGAKGFEPSTSWSRTRRASQAALRPETYSKLSTSLRGILRFCNPRSFLTFLNGLTPHCPGAKKKPPESPGFPAAFLKVVIWP